MNGWLFDTLLYTGLLIALVLVIRRPVGRLFGPQIAYALWALPFLRLLLPPVELPASLRPEVALVPAGSQMLEAPFQPDLAALSVSSTAQPVAAAAWDWPSLGQIGASIWFGGALAFLAWRVLTYRRMRRELLEDARPVGEIGGIRLVETPALVAPVAFGVIDKVIALPPLFMAQHDLLARDMAIEHEFAHHRGHDLMANFAAQVVLAMHWFNPIAWLGWRAMRRDQEAACDARVLAGRGREERVFYAALIANVAAGPRLALVAPMACPMAGERSIVHRLRSLSMNEISQRRRWLGRGLIASTALALPLTASFSYATEAQEPDRIAPVAPTETPAPISGISQVLPVAPVAPEAPEAMAPQARTFAHQREGEEGGLQARQFRLRHVGGLEGVSTAPPMPEMPNMDFDQWGRPADPQFGAKMEAWGKEMEKWGEEFGEKYAAQMAQQAEAMARTAQQNVPEVIESCDPAEQRRATTPDGRQRIVLCKRDYQTAATTGLRQARVAIARNSSLSTEVRNEVLRELDEEIRSLESERD